MPTASAVHQAAVLPSRGAKFVVQERATPTPGPNELLIEVKAIALNPIDYMQRKYGFPAIKYPAIVGSDIAGTVLAAGANVAANVPRPGTRVTAYAPSFFAKGAPNYGALQTRVLVPAENTAALPDSIGFSEAAVLPMAVQTSWAGMRQMGLLDKAPYAAKEQEGLLVWGAGGSVGCAAVQVAKSMGFRVYGTASAKHHRYLQSVGAHAMFDYKDADVVARIAETAKREGITFERAYLASGDLSACVKTLQHCRGSAMPHIAMAPFHPKMFLWRLFPTWQNTRVQFVVPPATAQERSAFFGFVFTWIQATLQSGALIPGPKVRVVKGGLQAAEQAVMEFKQGVSGEKLVLEV